MESVERIYKALQEAVEKAVGRKMVAPRDFDYLAMRVFDITRQYVSAMTLKRFWGYLGEKNVRQPRQATLNLLAQLVGYTDWMTYYKESSGAGMSQSDFLVGRTIVASSLPKGTMLRLMWHPDRRAVVRHEGYEVFTVVESVNSKLSVGDTFRCGCFIEYEPLYLSQLIHEGKEYPSYVCGIQDGVVFEIV